MLSGKILNFFQSCILPQAVLTQPYLKPCTYECDVNVQLKEGVSAGEYSIIVDKCREAVAGGHGLSLATVIHFYAFINTVGCAIV